MARLQGKRTNGGLVATVVIVVIVAIVVALLALWYFSPATFATLTGGLGIMR
jgi:hypothetical protein